MLQPVCPTTSKGAEDDVNTISSISKEMKGDSDFQTADLNDLVRDLNLPKRKDELLGSRLHQYNLLRPSTRISVYRKWHNDFSAFFTSEGWNDVEGLMNNLINQYSPIQWQLLLIPQNAV